jgi:hypothetical protein
LILIFLKKLVVLLGFIQEEEKSPGMLFLAYTLFSIVVRKVRV